MPPAAAGNTGGGVTSAASLRDLEFAPETNDAFEVGLKYNGRGIDINVAAFRQLFKNFQLNTFNGINFQVENINSCSTSINGADTVTYDAASEARNATSDATSRGVPGRASGTAVR